MGQVNLFRTQEGREKDFSGFLDARYTTIASSSKMGEALILGLLDSLRKATSDQKEYGCKRRVLRMRRRAGSKGNH